MWRIDVTWSDPWAWSWKLLDLPRNSFYTNRIDLVRWLLSFHHAQSRQAEEQSHATFWRDNESQRYPSNGLCVRSRRSETHPQVSLFSGCTEDSVIQQQKCPCLCRMLSDRRAQLRRWSWRRMRYELVRGKDLWVHSTMSSGRRSLRLRPPNQQACKPQISIAIKQRACLVRWYDGSIVDAEEQTNK